MIPKRIIQALCAAVLIAFSFAGHAHATPDPFPMPDAIVPNVSFWTQVYAHYSSDQGIVHDNTRLDIIYDIIELIPYDRPGAWQINRKRMKQAKQKYRHILNRLARNPRTPDETCRQIADLFDAPHDAAQFRRSASRVRCQIGQKDRFRDGLIRSGAYLKRIQAIIRSHGLPEDLAYLPHVESSFNTNAYSKFGAAGIWQFTRSTGKRFMRVGYAMDERRDPILATHAAARLLKENYARLDSWPLAITAYNHGASGMKRAQSRHGSFEKIFRSYRSRTFKFASRNFYAEFLAARHVAANHRDYFGPLELDTPEPGHIVELDGYIAFDDLCRHFRLPADQLKRLNPALRKPVLNGQKYVPKGYALRLPARLQSNEMSTAAIPKTVFKKAQKRSRFYTVQRGDTAGRIARTHGVKLRDLILANNLNRRATIYPRQTLRIPGPTGSRTAHHKPAVREPAVVLAANSSPAPSAVPEPEKTAASESAPPEMDHYPQPMLASVIPLTSMSQGEERVDRAGEAARRASNGEVVSADVAFERITRNRGRLVGIIQVEVEETLGHYAEWAGVATQEIRRLNRLRYGQLLRLHQKVRIPLNRTDAETFEQSRYEFHKRLQEDFYAVYRVGELQPYRVQRGDSIWTLCRGRFDIPMWLLKHCNPEVDLADLRFHQKLIIPTIEKISATDAEPGVGLDTEER